MPEYDLSQIGDFVKQFSDTDKIIREATAEFQAKQNKVKWCPHDPTTRQKIAIECDFKEILYGGAAGGGKSDWLLMEALQYVDVPNYAALLLRRTFADLNKPGALIPRSHSWLTQSPAKWNEQKKQWVFPSGAIVAFGYLENEADKYQYQSSEFQFIGFDELTQFTESQYTYMFSRLRRLVTSDIPIRMRSATNPGGSGAGWVKKRFIPEQFEPSQAIEDRVFVKEGADSEGRETRRAFVPARIVDNPHLDQVEYDESLAELDTVTREQLKHGDWSISELGDIYWMFDPRYVFVSWSQWERVFRVRHIPNHWHKTLSQDQGTTDGHIGATGWFATAAANGPLPGMVAMYRAMTVTQMSASEVLDAMLVLMGDRRPQMAINKGLVADGLGGTAERSTLYRLINSHEASSERIEYQKGGLPFKSWTAGPNVGIAQMRNYLTVIDKDQPNPFNPDLMGRTRFVIPVPDEDYPRRRSDSEWARVEAEFQAYHYKKTVGGSEMAEPVPYPFFNDYMDMCKAAAHDAFPAIKALTGKEYRESQLPENVRMDTMAEGIKEGKILDADFNGLWLARIEALSDLKTRNKQQSRGVLSSIRGNR